MPFIIWLPNASALTNQKVRLPSSSAKAVTITAPVTVNSRKRKNLLTLKQKTHRTISPYSKSPTAEALVAEVSTPSSTFFGCTRYESSLPFTIRSGRENALANSTRDSPKLLAASPHRSMISFMPYPPISSFRRRRMTHWMMKVALLTTMKPMFVRNVTLLSISLMSLYLTESMHTLS